MELFESFRDEPRPEESRGRSPLRGGGGGGGSGDPCPALPEVLPRLAVITVTLVVGEDYQL